MKFYVNKLIIFVFIFLFDKNVYANYNLEFSNYSNKNVNIIHRKIANSRISSFRYDFVNLEMSLDSGIGIRVNPNEHILIEDKYLIFFQNIETPCSWVHYFGKSRNHGWGINIFINYKEVGTICANKTSIFDFFIHARLVYNRDSKDNPFLQFYNTGWWENSSIFPTNINFEL